MHFPEICIVARMVVGQVESEMKSYALVPPRRIPEMKTELEIPETISKLLNENSIWSIEAIYRTRMTSGASGSSDGMC